MPKKYGSKALGTLHETVQGLQRLGLVDRQTMREFDASCLTPVEKCSPKQNTVRTYPRVAARRGVPE
jgi:putative transcriptional regulator